MSEFKPVWCSRWFQPIAPVVAVIMAVSVTTAFAGPMGSIRTAWSTAGGQAILTLDADALATVGLSGSEHQMTFHVAPKQSSFMLDMTDGLPQSSSGAIRTRGVGSLEQTGGTDAGCRFGDFSFEVKGSHMRIVDGLDSALTLFESIPGTEVISFDAATGTITMNAQIAVSAEFPGNLTHTSIPVGSLSIMAVADIADFEEFEADPASDGTPRGGFSAGPDVIVGGLTGDSAGNPQSYGVSSGIAAYAVGTTSCNRGNTPLEWLDNVASRHPVISQNLFRYRSVNGAGRFEQIGQSWLKHGFCALQENLCPPCSPYGGCCCDHLGSGCSDPYTASRNGSFGNLGPKYQVNAAAGTFIEPHAFATGVSTIRGRLQAATGDVDPSENPGALYYVEGMYVAADDATAGNDTNNASYRRVQFADNVAYTMSWVSGNGTMQMQPGINAWVANDPSVTLTHIDIPGDGRMTLGHRVTDLGNGTWHYEYALYNMNSDRSGQFFSVSAPECVGISNIGFHDVFYHSGEPFDGTDWPATILTDQIIWATTQTFAQNANANALRFGTLYNFRFDAATPPTTGNIKIGLFKPGSPSLMTVSASVPSALSCTKGDVNADTIVDGADVSRFVEILMGGPGSATEKCAGDLEFTKDCEIDIDDINNFANCLLSGGC